MKRKTTMTLAISLTATMMALAGCRTEVDRNPKPDMVAKVKAGEIFEARASWWGYDAKDSTKFLRAALSSGVKRLVIDRMQGPWYTEMLKGPSNIEIVFENGAEIVALRGGFKNKLDRLLTFRGQKNVTITGGTLRMWRDDYEKIDKRFEGGYRHALEIFGCENFTVDGTRIAESGGDGIYLNDSRNVTLRNMESARNARQGISVISAENLLIEHCRFIDTKGAPPEAGIDLEPNGANEKLVNVVIRDCEFNGNAECGIDFALVKLNGTSPAIDVRIERCTAVNNGKISEIVCWNTPANAAHGKIVFKDCTIGYPEGAAKPFRLLENENLPIELVTENTIFREERKNGTIADRPFDRAWVIGEYPKAGTKADSYPKASKPEWDKYAIIDSCPGKMVEVLPHRIRYPFALVFHAPEAGEVHFIGRQETFGKGKPSNRDVVLTDVAGKELGRFPMSNISTADTDFAVKVPARGFYRLSFVPVTFVLVKTSVPMAYDMTREYLSMNGRPSSYLMTVPPGNGQFAVFASGDLGEEFINAVVTDPSGKVVWDSGSIHSWRSWTSDDNPTEGLWKLDLRRPAGKGFDDYKCEIFGLPPFLFLTAEKYWK